MIGSIISFGMNMAAYAASSKAVVAAGKVASSAFRQVMKSAGNYYARKEGVQSGFTAAMQKMTANEGRAIRDYYNKNAQLVKEAIESRTSKRTQKLLGGVRNLAVGELHQLPANYAFYKMEKHRSVSPDDKEANSSFMKYYFGAPMMISLGAGAALNRVPGMSKTALKHILKKTTPGQREKAIGGLTAAARTGAELTDRAIAAARAARIKTGSAGLTSYFSFAGSAMRNKERFGVIYSKELRRLKTDPRLYTKRQLEVASFHNRVDAYLKDKEKGLRKRGQYDATQQSLEAIKKEFTEETVSGYNKVMSKPSSFMNMMNWMADNLHDERFRTTRAKTSAKFGKESREMDADFGKYVVGSTNVDFGRMNMSFMKDILINKATNGRNPISALVGLFGQKDMLTYQSSDHAVGVAFTPLSRGKLYTGQTYDNKLGLDHTIDRIIGIDPLKEVTDAQSELRRGFKQSQLDIISSTYAESLKGKGEKYNAEYILGKAFQYGEIQTKKGDFLAHFPGGKLKLYTSYRDAETGTIKPLSFQLGQMNNGEYLNYYKFTKQSSNRVARNFYGHENLEINGASIQVGPTPIGAVERNSNREGMWGRVKEELDLGYSKERWLGSKVVSIFKKFRDPRYAKTFFDKSYISNPEIRKSIIEHENMQVDLSKMLHREASDAMQHFVVNMTTRVGGNDAFVNILEESGNEGIAEVAKKFLVADQMASTTAKEKLTEFSNFLKEIRKSGVERGLISEQIRTVDNLRTAFTESQEYSKVYEIMSGIGSSKTIWSQGKRRPLTKVDEYNSLVLSTVIGEAGDRSVINPFTEVFAINNANPKMVSEFTAASHLSQFHHKVNLAITSRYKKGWGSESTDNMIKDSENAISELLTMYSDPGSIEFNSIKDYYKTSLRHSVLFPHDMDPRLKVEDNFRNEVFAVPQGMGSGFIRKRKMSDGSEIAEGIMDAGNTAVMTMLYSFNNVMSQSLGLGMDETRVSTPGLFIKSMLTKRIIPGMALYMGYNVLDRFADKTMDGTPLGEGITVFGANILAGARVAAANVMDKTGITDTAKYLENLMPGFIESPLSGLSRFAAPVAIGLVQGGKMGGAVGSLTGGLIGTAVGGLLGGGPLGLFGQWNINKSRDEVVNILSGREEVAIKKGRWWELGRCLTSDSNIPEIYQLPIKVSDISVNDKIISPDGSNTTILNIFKRDYSGNVLKITTYNNQTETVKVTGNHIIPVLRKYQDKYRNLRKGGYLIEEAPAETINPWDFIEIPIYNLPDNETTINPVDYIETQNIIEVGGRIYKSQINWFTGKPQRSGNHSIPKEIHLTYDLGKLFGYFLAEGNLFIHSNSREWHVVEMVHAITENDIVEDIRRITKEIFNIDITVRKKTTGTLTKEGCWITRICSSVLASLFHGLIYNNQYNDKFIPAIFMNANKEFKEGLIYGYWKGDGHYQFNRNTISSARYSLIYQSYMILSSLGKVATIPKFEENTGKGKYRISWNPDKSIYDKNQYFIYHKNRLYAKIADISTEYYSGEVYDFEVDNDRHLFVAGGVLIHNSAFEGTRTEYYRPHMYSLLRSNYKDTPGLKDSFMKDTIGALAPDIYAMQNYYSRPYPVTAGLFSDIPVFSSIAGMLPGLPIGGGIEMHGDDWSTRYQKGVAVDNGMTIEDIASTYGKGSGYFSATTPGATGAEMDTSMMPIETPIDRSGFDYAMGESVMNLKDIVGMRGFILGEAYSQLTGRRDMMDYAPELASPVDIAGIRRSYWDMELGGMLGMSEVIRRYIPRRRNQMEIFNPIINAMPAWLPNEEYMTDFQHGDAYTKITMGEARLPGAAYESIHNLDLDMPVEGDILAESFDSQMAYFLGMPEYMVPRKRKEEIAKNVADGVRENARKFGDLVKGDASVYNAKFNVRATVDAIVRNQSGERIPIKVAPSGFGGVSSLNAFLAMSELNQGMLMEVDTETGDVTQKMITKDVAKFADDLQRTQKARWASYRQMGEMEKEGKAMNLGNAYSWFNRYKILADVGMYSKEFREADAIVQQQMSSGYLDGNQVNEYFKIKEQIKDKEKAFHFSEYRFLTLGDSLTEAGKERDKEIRAEFSPIERQVGAAWEYVSHLRTPIHSKLLHKTTALEEYERNVVYGKTMPMWENPYEDFIKSYAYQMVAEDDPVQGALSWGMGGMLMGGTPLGAFMGTIGTIMGGANAMSGNVFIPERTQQVRSIMEQADAVEYGRWLNEYNETGDKRMSVRAARTMAGSIMNDKILDPMVAKSALGGQDKYYFEDIVNNVTRENLEKVAQILPRESLPVLYNAIGDTKTASGMSSQLKEELSMRQMPGLDSSIYDSNVPLDIPAYKTFEMEGLNAHDAGLGWYNQIASMNRLTAMNKYKEETLYAGSFETQYNMKDLQKNLTTTAALRSRLRKISSNVSIIEDGSDSIEVEIIM